MIAVPRRSRMDLVRGVEDLRHQVDELLLGSREIAHDLGALQDKFAAAQAVVDRCIRLLDSDGQPGVVVSEFVRLELRWLREGALK